MCLTHLKYVYFSTTSTRIDSEYEEQKINLSNEWETLREKYGQGTVGEFY